MKICDFCSSPQVNWNYPAESGDVMSIQIDNEEYIQKSEGGWAACDICHDLIEKNDRIGLLNRSVNICLTHSPFTDTKFFGDIKFNKFFVEKAIKIIHDYFFNHRLGNCYPVSNHNGRG